jgi:hypothetical protein
MHSPARNSEERADAWVPSERAVRSERGDMQAARSEWEDQQRMDERRHVRLPEGGTPKALPVSTNTYEWPNDDAPPNALAHTQRVPGLLSEQETRKFGCRKVVHDGEADSGDEEGV